MSSFTTPDRVLISHRPADMRAGIQRLASIVAADFGGDPQGGALCCFVSRDCEKMKMLRFDVDGWCLYYCRLAEGCFRWEHRPDYADPRLYVEWLLTEMPDAGELAGEVVDSFLPWSDRVPESCKLDPAAAEKAKEMPDDFIINIDPDAFDDEMANNAEEGL